MSNNSFLNPEATLGEAFDLPNLLYPATQDASDILFDAPTSELPQSRSPHELTKSPYAIGQQLHEKGDAHGANTVNGTSSVESPNKPAGIALAALSIVQELSDLNVKLYEHASTIPKPPEITTEPLSWKGKDFAMDKTFDLSQRMIKLLNRIYPTYQESFGNQSLKRKLSSVDSPTRQDGGSPPGSKRDRATPCLDQGSMLLLLSCYLRLIDTYDSIFGNMQACLDRSSRMLPEDYVSLPSVKIGSFSFPPTSALQITMVLHFASELLGRLRETTKLVYLPSIGGFQKPESQDKDAAVAPTADISTANLDAVIARQNELIQRIKLLRQSLMALDVI